ncbi:MAG: porphobilinogen synthase [Candidatus Hydrogenedentota bacterium]
MFPVQRGRRLRRNENIRALVRETRISLDNLVMPYFVVPGENIKKEILSMPGNYHFSIDKLIEELKEIEQLGIKSIMLFGIPERKDEQGQEAHSKRGIVQRAVSEIKDRGINLTIITDVCLCGYTSHGHCGIVKNGVIDNDATLEIIAKTALSHARAGADIVAPSDMMDGRVKVIRTLLDEHGYKDTLIMSYAAKYASAFYGPFREAFESTPAFGDRTSYQMDPPNIKEAMKEIAMDIEEGADIVMVKPALCYLDVISKAKERFDVPIAAYCVSGEYTMVELAADKGLIDRNKAIFEILISIKRAGADCIITYFTKYVAKILRNP